MNRWLRKWWLRVVIVTVAAGLVVGLLADLPSAVATVSAILENIGVAPNAVIIFLVILLLAGLLLLGQSITQRARQPLGETGESKIPLLPELQIELGEPFRRYFATVLARPFYPLPDQMEILERAKTGLTQHGPVIVLYGAGGVGKTAIAGEIVRQCASLGFLKPLGDSAKRQVYEDGQIRPIDEPARLEWDELLNTILFQLGAPGLHNRPIHEREAWIRRQFRLERYLVIVDNLETVENAREVAARLRDLLEKTGSRALMTFRFKDLADLRGVYNVGVEGLGEVGSIEFIKRELEARGFGELQAWLDEKGDRYETLAAIISLVRGLPLALQLVVGMRVSLPLSSVRDALCDVTSDTHVEQIYEFLFRKELELLSVKARRLLISAFSKQQGFFWDELVVLDGTQAEETRTKLAELGRISLIYAVNRPTPDGGDEDYFYIHPMLHQLLRKRALIGKWLAGDA